MTKDTYFEIFWIDEGGDRKGDLVLQFPKGDSETPGARIRELTAHARAIDLPERIRLRTQIHVTAPDECTIVQLPRYLWSDGAFNAPRFKRHLECRVSGVEPHLFQLRTGVVVRGESLVGRGEKRVELLRSLESTSCHLRAPRRYGKTSLLVSLEEQEQPTLFLDLAEYHSPVGFLDALLKGAMTDSVARQALLVIDELKGWPSSAGAADRLFDELVKKIRGEEARFVGDVLAALADAHVRVLFDEFSTFLRGLLDEHPGDAHRLLSVLRAARERSPQPLRCVLAGSAGLSAYIVYENLEEQFNDLQAVDLPPLQVDDARLLVEELFYGAGKRPGPAVIDRIIKHVGEPIPYFLQSLVHLTVERTVGSDEPTLAAVDQAYADLLGPPGNYFFRDFLLRERAYPATVRDGARSILRELAVAVAPVDEDALRQCYKRHAATSEEGGFDRLMTCLQEDYDLVQDSGAWRIRSKVLSERLRLGEPIASGR